MRLYRKVFCFLMSLFVLCATALLLRAFLVDIGLLGGCQLEALAHSVQTRGITVEEAIVTFYREILKDGTY